jgi:hypothetical protein
MIDDFWETKHSDISWWFLLISIIVIMGIAILLGGCLPSHTSPIPSPSPATGSAALIKMVDQNWLVTLGILLCAVGVMTGLNGSTKFMGWIGGGLTVIALASLTAALFALLADYSLYIIILLGTLIVIGFIAFFHTAADLNGDGKINWNDVKAVFKWKGKVK